MMERGGDVMTKVVPNVRAKTLHPIIEANVVKEFEFRFNRRMRPETMLSELLSRFPELDI